MCYALSDRATGDNPRNYTHGFSNTKEVIAFLGRAERDAWAADTKLLTAKSLTRAEALHWADTATGMEPGAEPGDKIARVYADDDESGYSSYHVIRRSQRVW